MLDVLENYVKMDNEQPVLHIPHDCETLQHYLQRYSAADTQRIYQNEDILRQFCTILLNITWSTGVAQAGGSDEQGLHKLWNILRRMDNYGLLLYHIDMLEPTRLTLLELLANSGNKLNIISRWCATGRLLGCAVDSASTIGGMHLAESESYANYANTVFRLATCFGLLGITSTFTEMKISNDTFRILMKQIQRDQDLFAPIKRWYEQSGELDKAMQNIFPFDFTNKIVEEFSKISNGENDFNPVRLLSGLLVAIAERDRTRLQDQGLIQNLVSFTACPSAQELCEWIIFRRQHPVVLDISRMLLQLHSSPLRFLMCQSVRALAPGQQNLYSVPVWGRILLNLVSISDAISSFWRSDVSGAHEMRCLEHHLKSELNALKRIQSFIQSKRNAKKKLFCN